jgi:NAD(P)-dependent dehydrogenase (short-subunit alcohol dehydrogenase family)
VKSAQNTETHWFRQVFSRFLDNRQPNGYGASKHAMAGFFDSLRVDTCARMIIQAVANHKREVVMTPQGKFGL